MSLPSGPQRSWGTGGPPRSGRIEYRLMRESAVREYHRGRLSRLDVCDAQPELLRVARNLGRETTIPCPICEECNLTHVSFAFGPRLPASGRAVTPVDLVKLGRHRGRQGRQEADLACYEVEVCTECSWNHMLRMYTFGGNLNR